MDAITPALPSDCLLNIYSKLGTKACRNTFGLVSSIWHAAAQQWWRGVIPNCSLIPAGVSPKRFASMMILDKNQLKERIESFIAHTFFGQSRRIEFVSNSKVVMKLELGLTENESVEDDFKIITIFFGVNFSYMNPEKNFCLVARSCEKQHNYRVIYYLNRVVDNPEAKIIINPTTASEFIDFYWNAHFLQLVREEQDSKAVTYLTSSQAETCLYTQKKRQKNILRRVAEFCLPRKKDNSSYKKEK